MRLLPVFLVTFVLPFTARGQTDETPIAAPKGMLAIRDLNYAGTTNWRQTLDLFVPEKPSAKPLPLIVFIHGGGWENGSKNSGGALLPLIEGGNYVGATINYRLTNEGKHPMQIHDCKAAIRWLRAHAKDYGIDSEKIGVFGISAGGHLVSLLGTGGDVKELEGTIGSHLDQSSRVTCVLNFCGPANFITFPGKGSTADPENPTNAMAKLLGGRLSERQALAKAASPVTYITKDDPPFLHIHGTKDSIVPLDQAKEFDAALEAAGISSTLITGEGEGHVFYNQPLIRNIRAFLDKHLRGKLGGVREGPIKDR